jgi:hypothetical protein
MSWLHLNFRLLKIMFRVTGNDPYTIHDRKECSYSFCCIKGNKEHL